VRNRDIGGLLIWTLPPAHSLELDISRSRQGNLYAGDTQNVNSNPAVVAMYGKETNVMERRNYALTHKGKYDFGTSLAYVQYTETDNRRLQEGLVGGTEGIFLNIANLPFVNNKLRDVTAHGELNLPLRGAVNQMLTVGVEWARQELEDPTSNTVPTTFGTIPGVSSTGRSPHAAAEILSLFAEDNIELAQSTLLTPGLRYDRHSRSGANWSPALNVTHFLSDRVTLKGGIAHAYKAPNLYQSNPNYLLFSLSNACATLAIGTTGCYLIGNADLKAETSVNKELGLQYRAGGFAAGITWFHNDYRDRIQAGTAPVGITTTGNRSIYQWTNIPKAVVQGLEGNLRVPLGRALDWVTNFTYMIESSNKTTGDYLSIIPEYTVNTVLDWRVTDQLGVLFSVMLYGEQRPMKFDFNGAPVTGTSANSVAPYGIANLAGHYRLSRNLRLTAGINNLFDKRQFRAGNAVSVRTTPVFGTSGGAGAATYNEPGRTFYLAATASF
jgi:ferric enterobactin receptor